MENDITLWSRGDVERYHVLAFIMERLAEDGWVITEDTGWCDFDLEASIGWVAKVRLVTVHEELEMGRRNIRCRITTMWRFGAGIFFWVFAITLVLVISIIASALPWIWMLLLLLPVVMLFIEHDEHQLAGHINAYLREAARELNLVIVEPQNEAPAIEPQQGSKSGFLEKMSS